MRYSASLRLKEHLKTNKIKLYSTLGATIQNKAPAEMQGLCCFWGVHFSSTVNSQISLISNTNEILRWLALHT